MLLLVSLGITACSTGNPADPSTDAPGDPPGSTGPTLDPPAMQRAFYVSISNGNDAWSGDLPDPNAGLTDGPKATLDAAAALVNGAAPGTHVLLRRGDVWNGAAQLRISTASGTEAAPIVLGAYG
ncbi:MAG: hypothetical protein ACI80K_004484, partial [Paracoccaceae bacterium]